MDYCGVEFSLAISLFGGSPLPATWDPLFVVSQEASGFPSHLRLGRDCGFAASAKFRAYSAFLLLLIPKSWCHWRRWK